MKVKTSELIDAALDGVVAKCEALRGVEFGKGFYGEKLLLDETGFGHRLSYSTNWAQGGPIIEREEIGSFHYIHGFHGPTWSASIGSGGFQQDGPTPLIAAMRCYVASKLGDTVDVPEELT